MSEESTGKIVSYTLDLDNPPELTAEDHEVLANLRLRKEKDIDYSDIPSQAGKAGWYRPGLHGAPIRRGEGVLVLDADVQTLFEGAGEARARKMNAVLREYAEAERKRA